MGTTTATHDNTSTANRVLRVTSKALPEHNRLQNRSLVLQSLFNVDGMSRADLARESGLTRVTISDLVKELSADGLIEQLGPRNDARVGKPATLIGIRADAFHIVSLDLSADDKFIGATVNLRGEIQIRRAVEIAGATGEEALALVIRLCQSLIEETAVRVLGVGVGSPGIVSHDGVVREAPNLGWFNLPIAQRLSTQFGVPVYAGNDANAAALGVHSFRPTSGHSLMVVTVEHGVGAGLIIGGALVEGEQFAAGEIGHVVVDQDGDFCACGRRGCLELVISAPRLRARLVREEDSSREAILSEAGHALGVALAPVISALNLNEVVLSGPAHILEGEFLDTAIRTIHGRTMSAVSNGLNMGIATAGEELVLLGASVFVLSAELGVS